MFMGVCFSYNLPFKIQINDNMVVLFHIDTVVSWGMASSAACQCGAEEQTVDHVVLQCPIHRPPHGLHGLTVLDNETTE